MNIVLVFADPACKECSGTGRLYSQGNFGSEFSGVCECVVRLMTERIVRLESRLSELENTVSGTGNEE